MYALKILILMIFAFVLNLPFGYLRAKSRKFSFAWFFYIHFPVPFVIFARYFLGLNIYVIPFSLAADVAGQIVGGKFI